MTAPVTPAPRPPVINFPKVDANSVKGFARAWDFNGIKMILDNTSIKFAEDFANQCLKSYVLDLINKAQAMKQKALTSAKDASPVIPPQANSVAEQVKPKSSLIHLTDGD